MNMKPVKPTCEAIRDRLTLYLLGDLDQQTQDTMARHLAECDACRTDADRLAPTLALLRDALQEDMPEAPVALSPEHRQRVIAAFRQRKMGKWATAKRKPLLLRFHILEMAAVLIATLMIFSIVTGNFGYHREACSVMLRAVEPEMTVQMVQPSATVDYSAMGEHGAIEGPPPMEGRSQEMWLIKQAKSHRYGGDPAREDARPPDASVPVGSIMEGERPREPLADGRDHADKPKSMDLSSVRVVGASDVSRGISESPIDQKHDSGVLVAGVPMDQDFSGTPLPPPLQKAGKMGRGGGGSNPATEDLAKGRREYRKDGDDNGTAVHAGAVMEETVSGNEMALAAKGFSGGFSFSNSGGDATYAAVATPAAPAPQPGNAAPPATSVPVQPAKSVEVAESERVVADNFEVGDRSKSQLRFAETPSQELSDKLNVPVDYYKALDPAAPAESAASVTPANFDSVAIVKSPVIMNGVLGSRSSGTSGEARREALSDDRDERTEIVNKRGAEYSRQRENTPPASGPVGKFEVAKEVPILGDIPVTGRLMANDKALSDGEVDRLENAESKKKSEDGTDSDRRDAIAIGGAVAGDLFTVGSGTVVSGGTLSAKESQVGAKDGDDKLNHEGWEQDGDKAKDGNKLKDLIPQSDLVLEKSVSEVLGDEELPDAFAPRFKAAGVNPLVATVAQPFSTFSIDVDTASYTVSRNYMLGGHLPPPEAVRTEEFVNFFDYAYDPPAGKTFRVAAEIAPSRFGRGLHLLKLGVKGRRLGREEQRQASLTLLVDSSGSMNQPDRLGLMRTALELLLAELADTDQVAIIQFDNRARLVLAHTPVAQRETILRALGQIQCGGGTNLEAGLGQAYEHAAKAFISRGENRILLMSDGVVNLGETATDGIVKRIEANRRQGLYLSVFGFGMGIYDDAMLKELASKGNGAYAFIDSEAEARRVFVDDLSSTLNTIAEDVKIQIEFNPKRVNQYRQLGYEQRQLTKEQFRDDTVDAGEVGSGQSVTALYELSLTDLPMAYPVQAQQMPPREADDDWLAVARVRYRRVDNGRIEEIEQRISASDLLPAFDAASPRFRLAAGAAAFAEILRGSPFVQGVAFDDVAAVLRPVALDLHLDARIRELVQMVETAGGLAR